MSNYIKLMPDKNFFESGITNYVKWEYDKYPHILIMGSTGSGKTYLLKIVLARIGKDIPNSQLVICDYKGDTDFIFLNSCNTFYRFDNCAQGLDNALNLLYERQNNPNIEKYFFAMVFDEWASYLNHLDKKMAEQEKQKLATLLMLGRSFNIHIVISQQRVDANYFASARDNFSVVIGLGVLSKESVEMIFSEYKDLMKRSKTQGEGSMIIGNQFNEIIVPQVYDINKLHNCIKLALDRYPK